MEEKKAGNTQKKNINQNNSSNKEKLASNAQSKSSIENKSKNNNTHKNKKSNSKKNEYKQKNPDMVMDEVILIITLLVSLLLILSYIQLCGVVGRFLNYMMFGLIGLLAYVFPFLLFFMVAFQISNRGSKVANRKVFAGIGFIFVLASFIQMITGYDEKTSVIGYFDQCGKEKNGGGIIGSVLLKIFYTSFGAMATILILIAILIICFMLITGKTFLNYFKETILNKIDSYKELRQNRYDEYEEEEDYDYEEGVKENREEHVRRTVKIVNLHKNSNDLDAMETIVDRQNESVNFIDSLKQIGKKKHKKSSIVQEEKKQDSYEMEEILAKKIQEISITGSYRMDDSTNNIYEEELKRKFGQVATEYTVTTEEVNAPNRIEEDSLQDLLFDHKLDIDILDVPNQLVPKKLNLKEEKHPNPVMNYNLFDQTTKKEDKGFESSFMDGAISSDILSGELLGFHTEDFESDFNLLANSEWNETFDIGESIKKDFDEPKKMPKKEENQRNSIQNSTKKESSTQTKKVSQKSEDDLGDISMALPERPYVFPSIDLLGKPPAISKGMTESDLKETAMKLQSTLESFGVRVSVTNISCGPAVTRYELQPEQGVSVKKITNLTNDIKLNLAASDIRIEAPISGKAAVGIEVPNKEVSAVYFRELIEHNDFKTHSSDVAFAVGRDIGGQVVVTDIAKMPHLLIAGATGSGKSVCINTLIMSILYKSKPSDVRLIMIDPKVVELSIYNGIPHLLIPVVTDPKKASAALNWAVMEMTDRYNKFAELGVRDLKGYNAKVVEMETLNDPKYQKLPQMVIIVDELADLMMVASNEVETAICRLAQMARAAGMHLIIATQRPSVNVITGVIKANVPSRIAFSVSSAIDSRTIIDSAGAESLLGKGDMLFFPSGIPKPIRVQGAFISDKEVFAVVDFLKEQNESGGYNTKINEQISNATSVSESGATSINSDANDRDGYFIEAGKFIIEKDKASIGMLQRIYKIGFNRAARIMDQLAEAGVVGPEEGTKPRKILMSMEEFEQYIENYI